MTSSDDLEKLLSDIKDGRRLIDRGLLQNLDSEALSRVLRSSRGKLSPTLTAALEAIKGTKKFTDDSAELLKKIGELEGTIREISERKNATVDENEDLRSALQEMQEAYAALERAKARWHLIERIHADAATRLNLDTAFANGKPCKAFVVSIDIRRSTDLMLNALEPRLFADFLSRLWDGLRGIIIKRFGVFDKFTGDGILAFFPDFYSGDDAGYLSIQAATECHEFFSKHYENSQDGFSPVIKETGLGIGIDYGNVTILSVGRELTVVGNPVVYACRLGSTLAGTTCLNRQAYRHVFDHYSAHASFAKCEVPFKHGGPMLAHTVTLNGKPFDVRPPGWAVENAIEPENPAPENPAPENPAPENPAPENQND